MRNDAAEQHPCRGDDRIPHLTRNEPGSGRGDRRPPGLRGPGWAAIGLLILFPAAWAVADPPDLDGVASPPGVPVRPLAFYSLDPTDFDPPTAWLPPLIQLLDTAGVLSAKNQPVADGILIASFLGAYRHRVALLDLKAYRHLPRDVVIERLKLVLVLEAPGSFARIRQTLQTILGHYGLPGHRRQTLIRLPGRRVGVRYRDRTWPPWQSFEWTADAQRFYFAIGEGTLAAWFEADRPGDADPRLPAHRAQIKSVAGRKRFLEVFCDLDGLRRSVSSLFDTGRTAPILQLFGLGESDQWMLHGCRAGSFVVVDATTRQGEQMYRRRLTLDRWPRQAGVPMPTGNFHLVAPVDWPDAVEQLLGLVRLIHEPTERPEFDRIVDTYQRQTGVRLTTYMSMFRPYLLASNYPRAWLAIPGTATLYVPLRRNERAEAAHGQFERLMRPLLGERGAEELGVACEASSGLHWLDSPLRELFKAPAWGWSGGAGEQPGRTFIASFSPHAVEENRKFLAARRGDKPEE